MRGMEKVATDIYTFSRLREDGFTYVDKRTIVEELVADISLSASDFTRLD